MLKNVIFDLDGTLWQTTNSYLYAYRKLCEFYRIPCTASSESVTSFLGVKLDKLLPALFPTVENQRELAYRAMGFSIEYLISHPEDSCYDGVTELLESLGQQYNVYIVSNCLKEYVETFLRLSGTERFVKAFYTIELGEKTEHIRNIVSKGDENEKTLFVGDSYDDYLSVPDHKRVFFCYAAYGYKDCLQYAYRIEKPLDLIGVTEEINVKERQLFGKPYRVFSYGDNQITLIENQDHSYYFGFIRYQDSDFEHVIEELKEACPSETLIGPIDGNTFYSYRLAIDHYDWRLYPDCISNEALVQMLLKHGFRFMQYYTSTLGSLNHRIWELGKRVKLPKGFRILKVSGKEAYRYVPDIYEVAVDAFSSADFYEEINKEDFIELYLRGLAAVTPDLLLIYDEDQPIAFNFCYEDPEKRFYVCKTTAIKKAYRNKRLILTLIDHSYQTMTERGYQEVLYHFQNDRTKSLYAIFKDHMIKQKRYALMELSHDQ